MKSRSNPLNDLIYKLRQVNRSSGFMDFFKTRKDDFVFLPGKHLLTYN